MTMMTTMTMTMTITMTMIMMMMMMMMMMTNNCTTWPLRLEFVLSCNPVESKQTFSNRKEDLQMTIITVSYHHYHHYYHYYHYYQYQYSNRSLRRYLYCNRCD